MQGAPSPIVRTARRAVLATALAALAVPAGAPAQDAAPARMLLPDLDQHPPHQLALRVSRDKRRIHLGFRSSVGNVGAGPLEIHGVRRSRRSKLMRADQVIRRSDRSTTRRVDVGRLRFETNSDHRHWHLRRFMTYELRTARGFRFVRPSRKAGFCLSDRMNLDLGTRMPGEPAAPVFTRECGIDQPQLLRIREGISVGHSDYYVPSLEGQEIDVTHVRSGRYWLVHRSDPRNKILESDERNNSAGLLVDIRWTRLSGGARRVRVRSLRRCPDGSRC